MSFLSLCPPSSTNPFMSICLLLGFFLYLLDSMVSQFHNYTCVVVVDVIGGVFSFLIEILLVLLDIIAYSHILMCMTSSYSNNHFNNSNWCYFGFKWITNFFESNDCAIDAEIYVSRTTKKKIAIRCRLMESRLHWIESSRAVVGSTLLIFSFHFSLAAFLYFLWCHFNILYVWEKFMSRSLK